MKARQPRFLVLLLLCLAYLSNSPQVSFASEKLEFIEVDSTGRGFRTKESQTPFRPVGFNYDHDSDGNLLEDYWETRWDEIKSDFREMKALGANAVRIHLQFGKFVPTRSTRSEKAFERLAQLIKLAEETGIYLNLTGLGCYHKKDVPVWYDQLSEEERWEQQAYFWREVAKVCAESPAIFCYDLMNEPVVPGGLRTAQEWLGGAFAGKHFVQFITLGQHNRERPDVAKAWIEVLSKAVREVDQKHLITVGLVDWSLDRPGLSSGFVPSKACGSLDFISVHIYPEKDKLDEAIETLSGFDIGKPIVVEETFPLKGSIEDVVGLLENKKRRPDGVFTFYWGTEIAELKKKKDLGPQIQAAWLEVFKKKAKSWKS